MKKNEVFGKTEQYGACRFCGQTNMVMAEGELTAPQLEEEATLACSCDEALEYAAEVTRERRVKEKIRKLCGESDGKGRNVTEEVQSALEALAGEICKKNIKGVTVTVRTGDKLEVKMMAKDKVKVGREKKSSENYEE